MPIAITKDGNSYSAEVTPPHGGGIAWSTSAPLPRDELISVLRARGCSQTDIGDAFYAADPNWLSDERT